jgi:tetratricopeptide (TPR) repeat protein
LVVTELALVGLAQQAGRSFFALLDGVPSEVAGGVAHDLAKLGVRSLAERAASGELPANHDLLRACRRSALRATALLARQFGEERPYWRKWSTQLAAALEEEARQAERDDYRPPSSALDGKLDELLGEFEAAPGPALQALIVDEVWDELCAWHEREWVPAVEHESLPPVQFEHWLREGWPYTSIPESVTARIIGFMNRRRGGAARMAHRSREAAGQPDRPGNITWFGVFAAYFAAELKTNERVKSIYVPLLLQRMNRRLAEAGGNALTEERLGAALTGSLDAFTAHIEPRMRAIVAEEARAAAAPVLTKLDELRDGVQRIEKKLESRGEVRLPPFQLPPPPQGGLLFGRDVERAKLRDRLARRENAAVIGLAGYGKTAVAAMAVRDVVGDDLTALANSPYPDGVVFLDLYKLHGRADAAWVLIAEAFHGDERSNTSAEARARLACSSKRALVVIEGAELADGEDGRSTLGDLCSVFDPQVRRLVLTRSTTQTRPSESIRLREPLAEAPAAALLRHHAGEHASPSQLSAVLELLGGHALALTWAGGLLARGDESAELLISDWRHGQQSLSDPEDSDHSLHWLFSRSVRTLDTDAQRTLTAAGLLAHAPFPLAAITAVAGDSERARAALRALVRASLLRWEGLESDHWQFTHVLGYRFSRDEDASVREIRIALAGWLHGRWMSALRATDTEARRSLTLIAGHVAALLRADFDQALWAPLAIDTLYSGVDRLSKLDRLETVRACLDCLDAWFARLPHEAVQLPTWQHQRLSLATKQGNAYVAQGELARARAAYEHALAMAERLAAADQSNADSQRSQLICCNKVGEVHASQGNLPRALEAFERSRAIAERLSAAHPSNAICQRDLATSWAHVGEVHSAQGKLPQALEAFERTREIIERLAAADPGSLEMQRDLAVSWNKLGGVLYDQIELVRALEAFEHSRVLAERLASVDPINAQLQRDVLASWLKIGDVHAAQENRPRAIEAYEHSRAIAERIASADQSNTQWQRDMSVCWSRIGDVRHAQAEFALALAAYEKVRAIRERLAATDPSNAEWQRDLSYNLTQLARTREASGDVRAALLLAEASLAIDERLASLDPTNATWQKDVVVSGRLVAHLRRRVS